MSDLPTKPKQKHLATTALPVVEEVTKASMRIADNTLEVDPVTGRFLSKVPEEKLFEALVRLINGDSMRNVTKDLGVSRSALFVKANDSPEFAAMLNLATEIGSHAMVDNALDAAMGGECSSGSIERDRLYVDYVKWLAARRNRSAYGEKLSVDHTARVITYQIKDDDVC